MPDLSRLYQPVTDCDPQFRYPIGYFESSNRVFDPERLKAFDPLLHPYLVQDETYGIITDPKVQHLIGHLENLVKGEDNGNLQSAIRFLELGSLPDASMEATYQCEDALAKAHTLATAGHHSPALQIIDSLPAPFRESPQACQIQLISFYALERFEEALACNRVAADDYSEQPHPHCYQKAVIEQAELLIDCSQVEAAETLLDAHMDSLLSHYQYYGVRAAIALAHNDPELAKIWIALAGTNDDFHAYKLLWQHSLKPLLGWMQHELLTEDGQSRHREECSQLRRLAHRIQGVALSGNRQQARVWAQALNPGKTRDPETSFQVVYAWLAAGEFARARRWASALPRFPKSTFYHSVEQICDLMLDRSETSDDKTLKKSYPLDMPEAIAQAFFELAIARRTDCATSLPIEQSVAQIWCGSMRSSGKVWLIDSTAQGEYLLTYMEGHRYKPGERRTEGYDPREDFEIVEQSTFEDRFAMADWLEGKLSTCDNYEHAMFSNPPHSFYINSATILSAFAEAELAQHTRLQACWQSYQTDPHSYFQNAPGCVYRLRVNRLEWVYGLL